METTPVPQNTPAEPTKPIVTPESVVISSQPATPKPHKSILKIIVLFVVLAGLGVGGYFAYARFIIPMMNPYAKMVPESLKDYAIGKNADGFIVYKKDQELDDNFKKLPMPTSMINDIQNAILLVQGSSQSAAAVVEFSSADKAQSAKQILDPKPGQTANFYTLELKNNLMIMNIGEGLKAFNGSLFDNPNLTKIDKTMINSQIIVYFNNTNLPETDSLLPGLMNNLPIETFTKPQASTSESIIPVAQAQGFISPTDNPMSINTDSPENQKQQTISSTSMLMGFVKDTIVYIRIKQGKFSVNGTINFLQKNELQMSPFIKTGAFSQDLSKLETTYDSSMEQFKATQQNYERAAGLAKMFIPSLETKITFENNTFSLNAELPISDFYNLAQKGLTQAAQATSDAPAKARDAARKADLNNIIVAIEVYNSDNQNYPQKSGCVDAMTELFPYFKDSQPPKDPNGSQDFKVATCPGGYYYQYIPTPKLTTYTLWAKMEYPLNNNIDFTPDEYEKNVQTNTTFPIGGKGGSYFIVNKEAEGTTNNDEAVTKNTGDPSKDSTHEISNQTDSSQNSGENSQVSPPPKKVPRVKK